MRISVIAVVVVGLLGGVASAQPAPDKAAAQAAYAEGQQRYAAGDYLPAAVKFEAAYALDPDPVYLFNVAQAYRLGNACPKAVGYYKRFLDEVPNPPNLVNVKQYLDQAEACARTTATMDPATATSPVVTDPPVTERPDTDDPGRTKRWLGIGAMFVGGATLGIGVYYTTEVGRLNDARANRTSMCTTRSVCEPGYGDELDDQGRSAQARQAIAYAVGGAVVIGGVVLYVLGRSSERSSIAVVPTSGGAYAVGAFTF